MSNIRFHNDTGAINHLWFDSHKNLLTSICIELGQTDKIDEMAEKFLGQPVKMKALKDPNKPKRAKSAYLFFCDTHREAVMNKMKADSNKIKIADVSKTLGAMWKKLVPSKRVPFEKLALADRERYKDEMEQYNA